MKHLFLALLISNLLISCSFNSNQGAQKIESLINENKDKSLFLGFWSKMNEEDFEKVKKFETEKGNLENGKFILIIPEDQETKKFSFYLNNSSSRIKLIYEDDLWEDHKEGKSLINDGYDKALEYTKMKDYLINLFDQKYKRIDIENLQESLIWGSEHKVIALHYDISYLDIYPSYLDYRDTITKIVFPPRKQIEGGTSYMKIDKNKKKARIAYGKIEITYDLYNKYLQEIKNHELNKKELQHNEEMKKKNNNELMQRNTEIL